jgi:hypothetical protein
LFDANHYQIIDGERYRSEEQFYAKPAKKEQVENTDSSQANNTAESIQNNQVDN